MSTQINVTVGGGGLVNQSKINQQANRNNFVERSQEKEVSQQASEEVARQQAVAQAQRDGAVPSYGIREETSAQRGGFELGSFEAIYSGDKILLIPRDVLYSEGLDFNGIVSELSSDDGPNNYLLADLSQARDVEVLFSLPDENSRTEGAIQGIFESEAGEIALNSGNWVIQTLAYSIVANAQPPVGGSQTITTVSTTTTSNGSIYNQDWICLPVNGGIFIACYLEQSFSIYNRIRLTATDNSIDSVGGLIGPVPPNTFVPDADSFLVKSTYRDRQYAVETRRADYVILRCFLFSPSQVKEIATPSELAQSLAKIYPVFPSAATQQISGSQYATSTHNNGFYFSSGAFVTPSYTIQKLEQSSYDSQSIYLDKEPPASDAISFGRQFGLGYLTTDFHLNNLFFTASIFSWLKGELVNASSVLYQDLRDVYFRNAPNLYVDVSPFPESENPDDFLKVGLTRRPPLSIFEAVEATGFTYNKMKNKKAFIIWDWNKPALCRAKLNRLGFSGLSIGG